MTSAFGRPSATALLSIGLAATLLAACGSDDGSSELDAALAMVDQLRADLEAAEEDAATARTDAEESAAAQADAELALDAAQEAAATADVDKNEALTAASAAEAERDSAIQERDAETREREAAVAELDAALAANQELLLRFDPQVKEALAGAELVASDTACSAADSAGFEGALKPTAPIFADEALEGLPDGAEVDLTVIETRIDGCYAAGELRAVETELRQPKGDGFWTVGLEIAPGLWRSTGTGDGCYWQRSPDGNPDDILDNHFGNAGGSVTLRQGEEFETDDCGLWEFAG